MAPKRTLFKVRISIATAMALALLARGSGQAQTAPGGPDHTEPEVSYTIPPSNTLPIAIHASPHAICSLTAPTGADGRAPILRIYADDEGVARFYPKSLGSGTESGTSGHVVFRCVTNGNATIYPVALFWSSTPTAQRPLPQAETARPLNGEPIPALTEAEASTLSDEELRRRHYPPRPSATSAPAAYNAWLRAVSTASVFVVPYLVPNPDRHHGSATSRNWSGYLQRRAAGSFSVVGGFYAVPAVTIPNVSPFATAFDSTMWVGLNGSPELQLVQAGTEQDVAYVGLSGSCLVGACPSIAYYYAWTEVFDFQSEQVISNAPVNAGDNMLVQVFVDNAPSATGTPSAFTYSDSNISLQQHVFYRDPNNAIWQVYWDQGHGLWFEIWAGAGSPTNAPMAAGDPATMVWNSQQHIFYRDGAGNIQHVLWDPSSGQRNEQWAGGSGSSTTGPAAAGDPATLVWNNQQHIFYRDQVANIQHVLWAPDSGRRVEVWAGGTGGSGGGPAAWGDPKTMIANNQQHIFYRASQLIHGPDNPIWHVFWDPNSGLRSEIWAGAGSPTNAPGAAGDPATMVSNGQQHIFYRDAAGNIQHVLWDPSSGQRNEQWAGGSGSSTTGPAAAGEPATLVWNNQQHIFYRDNAGNIQHVWWDPSSGMHPETWAEGSGSSTTGPVAAGDPVTMVWNSQQHIFYRDMAGNIWHVFWDPSSGRHAEQWAGPGPNGMGNYGEFFVKNITQGWSTQLHQVIGYGATSGVTAEWIMERPQDTTCILTCSSSYDNLANYGTTKMTGAFAGTASQIHTYVCCDSSGIQFTMTSDGSSSGTVLSTASSPNNTTADFTFHAPF
jgi:Peptidase A4 family/Repeat of unknown function (DUF346)